LQQVTEAVTAAANADPSLTGRRKTEVLSG